MNKFSRDEKLLELKNLKLWCTCIITFFHDTNVLPHDECKELSEALNNCVLNPNLSLTRKLTSMRIAVGDLNEWASDLSPEQKKELNKRLREEFGSDLCTIDKRMAKRMESVLKRGKIRNDDEYTRVSEWIDHLLWDPDKQDQQSNIAIFERLLGEYVEKKSIKSNKH